ncbi:hypothetical protein ACQP1P_01895 [Dactylosporangium sp. CA-052675]|uniref:hypothetical protein n=1 Tax=Dactylosporangium sp. CA-052675 TaxID=3239927 RepID=UPI003D8C4D2C
MGAEWEIADAWVFAAVSGSGPEDGGTLARVIGAADGINHAILTEDEFVRAVPRLVAAGLIGADAAADRYWHTAAGRAIAERWHRRGLFAWAEVVPPALRGTGEPAGGSFALPAGAFAAAVREYLSAG